MALTRKTARTALPLGCNCQLGMALSLFGHHDSSLFRWANAGIETVMDALEGRPVFAGRTAFRFVGTQYGTLEREAMRERLASAPEGGPINTIVHHGAGPDYVHGVQLSRAQARAWTYEDIAAANAAKIAHLLGKWRAALQGPAAAMRLEWTPIMDPEPHVRLAQALRRRCGAAEFCAIGPAGGLEGRREGVDFLALSAPLPPLSDVMNVAATQAEWRRLFERLSLAPQGRAPDYIFDL